MLCPGSRNAPLAFALHDADRAGRIRLHVRIDERTAGFLAIGLAVAERAPVCVAMTSGTAVANLGPGGRGGQLRAGAADRADANRPYELLGTGANQTIEQLGYFGTQVRANISLGLAEDAPESMDALNAQWRSATCRVLVAAKGSRTGQRRTGAVRHPAARAAGARRRRRPAPYAPEGRPGRQAVDLHAAGDVRPAAGHRRHPGHGRHRRARRGRAPESRQAADGRRAHRAARGEPAAPVRAAAAAPATGDHAGPPDAAPAGARRCWPTRRCRCTR